MAASLLRSRAFVTTAVLNMSFLWVIAGGYDTLVPLFVREGLGMSTAAIGGVFAIAVDRVWEDIETALTKAKTGSARRRVAAGGS